MKLQNRKPTLQLQYTVEISQSQFTENFDVIAQSQNGQFLAFQLSDQFYLIENQKILFTYETCIAYCAFCSDQKYAAIIYEKQEEKNRLILFDIDKKQVRWRRRLQKYQLIEKLFFLNDEILIQSCDIIEVFTLKGKRRFINLKDICVFDSTIYTMLCETMSNNLLVLLTYMSRNDPNSVAVAFIFSFHSQKVVKRFISYNSIVYLVGLTQQLVIQIPEDRDQDLKLINMVNLKILRKIKLDVKNQQLFEMLDKKSIINYDLYYFRKKGYYRVNFLKGSFSFKGFDFNHKIRILDEYYNYIQLPFFLKHSLTKKQRTNQGYRTLNIYKFMV